MSREKILDPKEWLTIEEASELTRLPVEEIQYWIKMAFLRAINIKATKSDRVVLIRKHEMREFIIGLEQNCTGERISNNSMKWVK